MAIGLSNHELYPRVVRAGVPSTVSIVPVGTRARFDDSQIYNVGIVPIECSTDTYIEHERDTVIIKAQPKDGVISFTYTFEDEQEWAILLAPEANPTSIRKYAVYSLYDDLYERTPYMGDLHSHSNCSDGNEEPAIVAANYRKYGFDFFALTDHHKFQPSLDLIDYYKDVPIDLKIFPGEEIHLKGYYIHAVNFGAKSSVNEYYNEDVEKHHQEIKRLAETYDVPKGINALEFAYRKWIADEIHKRDGFAIIAHPCWINRDELHMRPKMVDYLLEKGLYDAMEIVSGVSQHETNLQTALYNDQRAKGRKVAIVGSSDCHGTDPACFFNNSKTVLFAKDLEYSSVCSAIKDLYAVALETRPGESVRVYGSFRLVKYTRFLLTHYFPMHHELCCEEGRLMKEYIRGDKDAVKLLSLMQGRTKKLADKLLK